MFARLTENLVKTHHRGQVKRRHYSQGGVD